MCVEEIKILNTLRQMTPTLRVNTRKKYLRLHLHSLFVLIFLIQHASNCSFNETAEAQLNPEWTNLIDKRWTS